MTEVPLPLEEVTRRALDLLFRELGPVDALRFLGRWQQGSGDYTAERDQLLAGQTLDQIDGRIRARQLAASV